MGKIPHTTESFKQELGVAGLNQLIENFKFYHYFLKSCLIVLNLFMIREEEKNGFRFRFAESGGTSQGGLVKGS